MSVTYEEMNTVTFEKGGEMTIERQREEKQITKRQREERMTIESPHDERTIQPENPHEEKMTPENPQHEEKTAAEEMRAETTEEKKGGAMRIVKGEGKKEEAKKTTARGEAKTRDRREGKRAAEREAALAVLRQGRKSDLKQQEAETSNPGPLSPSSRCLRTKSGASNCPPTAPSITWYLLCKMPMPPSFFRISMC